MLTLINNKKDAANKSSACIPSNSRGLETSLFFFDSSSDSDSDDDDEIVECLLQARKALSTHLNVIKELKILLEKGYRNCIKGYFENIVPTYSDEEFKRHFRISKELYKYLCIKFGESDIYNSQRIDKRLSETIYIAVFLWFAGHEACSYRDIADRFDLALGTVCKIIHRVSFYMSNLSPSIIKWPDNEKKVKCSKSFKEKCGFSRAIGCVGGTHIVIDLPKNGKDEYINRSGNASLCLQAVCDENKKFISIFVGYPGSSHDSWVFQNSPLRTKLSSLCQNYYLLGDSAYPCNLHLITPYRDNGHLRGRQRNFNIKLNSGRVIIEHSFIILKQRFRQLNHCKIRGVKHLCHFIRACCVLHNIASEDGFQLNDEVYLTTQEENSGINETESGNDIRDVVCQEIDLFN